MFEVGEFVKIKKNVIDLDTLVNMSKAGKSVGEFCQNIVKLSISKGTKYNVMCIVISFNE